MFDKIYITVESSFCGPTFGFICAPPKDWGQLENIFSDCATIAADAYHALIENMDVPYDVLWESITITGVSTYLPPIPMITWINLN